MGNNPSTTSKPTGHRPGEHHHRSTSGSGTGTGPGIGSGPRGDSPRANKKEAKNLILAHQQQHRSSASSPEASVVQAHGSTISSRTAQSRPLSTLTSSSPATTVSSVTKPRPCDAQPEPSKPLAVPNAHNNDNTSYRASHFEDVGVAGPLSSSLPDPSYYPIRPPRLPLPIQEEVHTPGSPITSPADFGDIDELDNIDGLGQGKQAEGLTRNRSGLSTATDDDDAEELRQDKSGPTVQTRVEWLQGGSKVYVTGTPFEWSRKQRLHPAPGREGVLEAWIPAIPGTHHIKFLVNGGMETSKYLPTTVDFGNNLVNYIEVVGDDVAAHHADPLERPPKTAIDALDLPSRQASYSHLEDEDDALEAQGAKTPPKASTKKLIAPPDMFHNRLPDYLVDFDQPEDTKSYHMALAALDKLPQPPILPGFLGKPILNNNTSIKDDNSVLNMPNHTVLNHLGTCSIKNNVLAVSATTRYKNKYVTTIIYKPTSDDC